MSDNKSSDKGKENKGKMYSEEEFNKELTRRVEEARSSVLVVDINVGYSVLGGNITPSFSLKVTGGDRNKLIEFGQTIQQLVIELQKGQ